MISHNLLLLLVADCVWVKAHSHRDWRWQQGVIKAEREDNQSYERNKGNRQNLKQQSGGICLMPDVIDADNEPSDEMPSEQSQWEYKESNSKAGSLTKETCKQNSWL